MVIQVCHHHRHSRGSTDGMARHAATAIAEERYSEPGLEAYVPRRCSVNARLVGVSILCCLGCVDETVLVQHG